MTKSVDEPAQERRRLDALFTTARRHECALTLALRVNDEMVAIIAAARLRNALARSRAILDAIGARDPASCAALVTMFQESTHGMHELLQRAPTTIADRDRPRYTRWGMAMAPSVEEDDVRPLVFELNASGKNLQEAAFLGLHVARSRFIADLRRAQFVDALVEASDFTYSDLRNTLWQRTRIERSFFRDSWFRDAWFDNTEFVDCDLRGVDFSMDSVELATATAGVTFIRCDLREATWLGRSPERIEVIDCRMSDAAGLAAPSGDRKRRCTRGRGPGCDGHGEPA